MKIRNNLLAAILIVGVLGSVSVFAETTSRADVRAATASAVKSGEIERLTNESYSWTPGRSTSHVTRREVRDDTLQALRSGEIERSEIADYEPMPIAPSVETRAEVKADLQRALASGQVPAATEAADALPQAARPLPACQLPLGRKQQPPRHRRFGPRRPRHRCISLGRPTTAPSDRP